MSEVTKLYENAGIEPKKCSECDNNMDCGFGKDCYPPFTAEKQIELIEWIIGKYNEVSFSKRGSGYNICIDDGSFIGCHHNDKSFEESLAGVINKLWTDMPEEEKQQVKGILK